MKEDFLHYIWKFKKFRIANLRTSSDETLTIVDAGQYLQLAGPDFFNAQIVIGTQKWAGNIEIHVKSSDWYLHHHESDPAYENVILHVVWEHDTEIFRSNNSVIPVLILSECVDQELLSVYQKLTAPKSWIFCERELATVDSFVLHNWQERLFFERLERKIIPINRLLAETNNDWEATLFYLLAKNFGLNTNGDAFFAAARLIPFSVLRKERGDISNIEALLFGYTGLLRGDYEDIYANNLWARFSYLIRKHALRREHVDTIQFFKHRPDNFPTLRLSQLASLYHQKTNLFTDAVAAPNVRALYQLFSVEASEYWETHYQFDRPSPLKKKALSRSFIDLLIINTIIPIRFAYNKSRGLENHDELLQVLGEIMPEHNSIIDKFAAFGITAKTAFESQSLLQLKNEYCNLAKCTSCAIGVELLKSTVNH